MKTPFCNEKKKKLLVLRIEANNLEYITTVMLQDRDKMYFNKILKN